ncbi:MAG: M23 family metallopeptidase [Patescibacteria group bacterium]
MDFLVKDGTLVYAVKSGTVVEIVESNDVYGPGPDYAQYLNFVTIDHVNCYSQYAHLKKGSPTSYGLYVGKKVVTGQVIGIVGKSGWVDYGENGDHLHFMVFRNVSDGFISLPVEFKTRVV